MMSEIILGPGTIRPRMMMNRMADSVAMPTVAMEVTHDGEAPMLILKTCK